jgi:predicted DNA-binding transcriptional regulator YafY
MAATSRVLALLGLLQSHRHWSGPALAARLEVTERTLRRDVERLRDLGYRIDSTRGVAGGYRLDAGTELPPLLLTADEAVTIAIGLRLAATRGIEDADVTTLSALAKLEQVLPAASRRKVAALTEAIHPRGGSDRSVSTDLLGRLALACRDGERLRFRYSSADGAESDRLVDPHSLVVSERAWLLVCFDIDRDAWRTFRVDRISGQTGTRVIRPRRQAPAGLLEGRVAVPPVLAATVELRMPHAVMLARFGRWADGAEAIDAERTRWTITGSSIEEIGSALVWIPAGVQYTIDAAPDVLDGIRLIGAAMGRRTTRRSHDVGS